MNPETTEVPLATSETLQLGPAEALHVAAEKQVAQDAGSVLMESLSDETVERQPDGTYRSDREGVTVIWVDSPDNRDTNGPMPVAE